MVSGVTSDPLWCGPGAWPLANYPPRYKPSKHHTNTTSRCQIYSHIRLCPQVLAIWSHFGASFQQFGAMDANLVPSLSGEDIDLADQRYGICALSLDGVGR